jgi:hypothetical protein
MPGRWSRVVHEAWLWRTEPLRMEGQVGGIKMWDAQLNQFRLRDRKSREAPASGISYRRSAWTMTARLLRTGPR